MKIDEAIRILDPKTRRKTLKEIPWDKRIDTDQEACEIAIAALRAQQEAEKNDPLTMDELREMDGEPVWVNIASGVAGDLWTLTMTLYGLTVVAA